MLDSQTQLDDRRIAQWLLFCAAAIFCMIILGGVTRLTESGLSMVEWKPLIGALPPLNQGEWQETFEKYQQYPQYQKVNTGMDLEAFKSIFYFEYGHRLLGRLIGIFFLVPFLYFWFSRRIKTGLTPILLGLFVLGGLQGLLGWFMVKSGLVDNPRVSQYRLAAHMGLAVLIYCYILWTALGLLQDRGKSPSQFSKPARGLSGLLFLMIISGALVAGTRAGLVYPTWPLMGDSFIPPLLYNTTPAWLAAFEDLTTIQFNHRLFAYTLIVLITLFSVVILRRNPSRQIKTAVLFLLTTLTLQVSLGIATLLHHVPVALAASHQAVAVLLLSSALFLAHSISAQREPAQI